MEYSQKEPLKGERKIDMEQVSGHTRARQAVGNVLLVLLGNTLYALGVTLFILPSGLITGGTTGLALVFEHAFGLPITWFVSGFNLVMFLLGALVLGKRFAVTTLISTFYYPVILGVFQAVLPAGGATTDRLLATVYAGLLIGVSIGIVIRAGASTGGMDIPPLVLHKQWGLSVSGTMYAFDFAILISQMLFADREQVLYGILLVLIYTMVLDKVLLLGQSKTQVKIISKEYERINEQIIQQLDRGSTLVQAQTGYCREEVPIVLSVISNRELPKLNQLVNQVDPKAFLVISRVNEVRGRGFSMGKVYR